VQDRTRGAARHDDRGRTGDQTFDATELRALVLVRGEDRTCTRTRTLCARWRRVHDHRRVAGDCGRDGCGDRLDRDLERTEHDVARADHARRDIDRDQSIRARRNRDRVLAPGVDGDDGNPGRHVHGGRELGALDTPCLEIGANHATVIVVADAADEMHLGAERSRGGRLVRALAAERLYELAVGDGLSWRRQPRPVPPEIDVRRPDHDHASGHHRKVSGTRTETGISDNGRIVTALDRIRCLSIIAHIDHGKSTLADRLLEMTGAVDPRNMRAQYLDTMDLERERGITIKAQNVRLEWNGYIVNLIDTPGHVDFGYEVSRSLAACEGVILLVDASQGIEAQTLANCYLAMENDLTIVAALNKIDLPAAEPDKRAHEIERVLGIRADDVLRISAKTGAGVSALLDAVVEHIPAPKGDPDAPLQALMFDSNYDAYRGVISSVRVFNGVLRSGARLRYVNAKQDHDAEEVGVRLPLLTPVASLGPGEVGYLIAGIKDVGEAKVGETVTDAARRAEALAGYREPKPMVFCGLYPVEGDEYADLREALERLRLNDSSFTYEPETSGALGFGFRCGFLGLLHMEIVRERLEREYDLSLVASSPNVEYRLELTDGSIEVVDNPSSMPPPQQIEAIEEPYVRTTILTPTEFVGTLMELSQQRRGEMEKMEYLSEDRVELVYVLPLAEIVLDFFDQMKSRTRGYASLDYEPVGYRRSDLAKVDVLLNATPVDAFSAIVHRDKAYEYGKKMTSKLRELIPRQLFDVPIQAAIGGRIIARETVKAKRKDVLAKCYGGDITRKRKLLERQKEGKKKMKQIGRVEVPQEAFVAALRLDE
jgi:GTP-binding protein LepA